MLFKSTNLIGNVTRTKVDDRDVTTLNLSYYLDNKEYEINCKLNQYPENKVLQNLLTYGLWTRNKSLEELRKLSMNPAGAIDPQAVSKIKAESVTNKDVIKFSRSVNNYDYNVPLLTLKDPEKRLFDFLHMEVNTPGQEKIEGDIGLKGCDITIKITPSKNLITLYIGLDMMSQDTTNDTMYHYLQKLPKNIFKENFLGYLILDSSGIEIEFFDIIRNYIPDEFARAVLNVQR